MIDKSEFSKDELEKLKINDVVEVFLERVENFNGQVVISY